MDKKELVVDSNEVKHLEMIQAVATRLAGNSFSIKGWSIALVSILCSLAAKDANIRFAILALLPALSFWGLDAYYLWQERLFRALYSTVQNQVNHPGIHRRIPLFSMNTQLVADQVDGLLIVLVSKTIISLHAPILAAVIAVTLYAARFHP